MGSQSMESQLLPMDYAGFNVLSTLQFDDAGGVRDDFLEVTGLRSRRAV